MKNKIKHNLLNINLKIKDYQHIINPIILLKHMMAKEFYIHLSIKINLMNVKYMFGI